ncbi:MAG: hypothetical protein H0V89_14840, partial [Deltaproteobacteria bacterium]|nr:hypothetical protein [Deltaproteobacteria bacterium]
LGGESMAWGPTAGPLAKEDVREVFGLALVASVCAGVAAWGRDSPGHAPGSA